MFHRYLSCARSVFGSVIFEPVVCVCVCVCVCVLYDELRATATSRFCIIEFISRLIKVIDCNNAWRKT